MRVNGRRRIDHYNVSRVSYSVFFFLCSRFFTVVLFFFFSSRRRHTRLQGDWIQTCALPISDALASGQELEQDGWTRGRLLEILRGKARSEERRVGKECRSRWSPYH